MSWLYPWGLLGLLAVPVLVALSLWRWRRREVSVSSLLLWRDVAAAWREAPKAQRRRRVDPLLVLRVALAVVLTAALCGLAWVRPERVARRLVIVADLSASMAARRPDGGTRWQACADALRALIDRAGADGRVTVVPLGPNFGLVRRRDSGLKALADLAPTSARLEPSELVNAATNALREHPGAVVVVATDQRLEGLPEGVHVLATGGTTDNRGVVALAARRRPDRVHEVLVGVANASSREASVEVVLSGDGKELGRQRTAVPARGRSEVIFEASLDAVSELAAQLSGRDGLAADDRAWLRRRTRAERVAWIGEASPALHRALAVQEDVEVVEGATDSDGVLADCDLAVYYRVVPRRFGRGRLVVVAPRESVGQLRLAGEADVGEGAVAAPRDPLMAAVKLDGVRIGRVARAALPGNFDTLASAGDVPLIGRWREGEAEVIYVAIDPARSNWPLTPSFPIFWANVVTGSSVHRARFAAGGLLDEAETMTVGDAIPLPDSVFEQAAPEARATVVRPLTGGLALVGLVLVAAHGWLMARRRI